MSHTREPWHLEIDGKYTSIYGANGKMIVPHITNSKKDHARIVACVNACAGIPEENLHAMQTASNGLDAWSELMQQRDELLAALEIAMRYIQVRGDRSSSDKQICEAARATGGSK